MNRKETKKKKEKIQRISKQASGCHGNIQKHLARVH